MYGYYKHPKELQIMNRNQIGGNIFNLVSKASPIEFKDKTTKIPKSIYIPKGLKLDNSIVPGAGLGIFATQDYPEGYDVGRYKGRWLTPEQFKACPKQLLYVWEVTDYRGNKDRPKGQKYEPGRTLGYWDAEFKKDSNYMRYVNHPRNTKEENISAKQKGHYIHYVATRPIKAGEELFVNYGPSYSKLLIGSERIPVV